MANLSDRQGFVMPMFKPWVPQWLRPWLYCYLAFTFQMSSAVYLGSLDTLVGSLQLMREDVLMCLYASLAGITFGFPFLFRTKFRFTNRSLLLFSCAGMVVCNYLGIIWIRNLPLIWVVSFCSGYFKIQGTFECMSNIQLWISKERDYRVFFPVLHIFILIAMIASEFLAMYITYVSTWHYMPWLMIGVMLFNILWLWICTWHFRFMKMPFLAIDWLGAVLWILAFMQVIFIFCYGEYYRWLESDVIRTLIVTTLLTFGLAVLRMLNIHHPYIEPRMWTNNKRMYMVFLLVFVVEMMLVTEHVLEEVFYEGMHWDKEMRQELYLPAGAGVIASVLFCLFWLKVMGQGRVRLIAIGVATFVGYCLYLYFNISSQMPMHKLHLPLFLRGFAVATLAITLLYTMQSMMHFTVFFQSLAIFQTLRMILGGVVGAALYSFGIRYLMADGFARYGAHADAVQQKLPDVHHLVAELQVASVKQLYGIVIYVAIAVFLVVLLYDIPFTRDKMKRMPSWKSVGKLLYRKLFPQSGQNGIA